MKRLLSLALVFAGVAIAAPAVEIPSAYRLYKLCDMQDPQCLPILRKLHHDIVEARPVCKQYAISDQQLYANFMQITTREPSLLNYPALTAERYALSLALPCF